MAVNENSLGNKITTAKACLYPGTHAVCGWENGHTQQHLQQLVVGVVSVGDGGDL